MNPALLLLLESLVPVLAQFIAQLLAAATVHLASGNPQAALAHIDAAHGLTSVSTALIDAAGSQVVQK